MDRMRSPRLVVVAVVTLLAVSMAGCTAKPDAGPPAGTVTSKNVGRPECPVSGDWSSTFSYDPIVKSPGTPNGELSLSSPITNVPEFHDCQQFITVSADGPHYTSLFAIFARFRLDTVSVDSTVRFEGPAGQRPAGARGRAIDPAWAQSSGGIPMGEIYSYDQPYAPLGIEKGFNCLYVYPMSGAPAGLEARVVPVGNDEGTCTQRTNPKWSSGTVLQVSRSAMPGAGPKDYPPVARWDWDAVHRTQYIGIRCGNAWCEIAPKFQKGKLESSPIHPTASGATQPERRVAQIKGWYDEQRLAIPAKGVKNALAVGSLVGTLTPSPSLGDFQGTPATSGFAGQWQTAATLTLESVPGVTDDAPAVYQARLNAEQSAPLTTTNVMSLCFDTAHGKGPNACVPSSETAPSCSSAHTGWFARIVSASQVTKYYCVIRRAHEGVQIPGVTRLRFKLTGGETIWARCLDGCCEVDAG